MNCPVTIFIRTQVVKEYAKLANEPQVRFTEIGMNIEHITRGVSGRGADDDKIKRYGSRGALYAENPCDLHL